MSARYLRGKRSKSPLSFLRGSRKTFENIIIRAGYELEEEDLINNILKQLNRKPEADAITKTVKKLIARYGTKPKQLLQPSPEYWESLGKKNYS